MSDNFTAGEGSSPNCFYLLFEAMSTNDDSYRECFNSDVGTAMTLSLSAVTLNAAWMGQLMQDRITMILDSLAAGPGAQMQANADQIVYNTHSMMKDTQCNQVQQSVKLAQSQINSDNQNRQSNFSAEQGVSSFFAEINAMVKQKF